MNMDIIKIKKNKSIYPIYKKEYFDLTINGVFLNEYLDRIVPGKDIKGLVPTFSGWLANERDEKIVWERILPGPQKTAIVPILICPDDQDYSCSVIVVEVINQEDGVYWNKFGLNNSYDPQHPEIIGSNVDWFDQAKPLIFNNEVYKKVVLNLKEQAII
jgi:hypothetical protein